MAFSGSNLGWLFLEKLFRLFNGLIVGVALAQYLGPEKFGKISYALSLILLCTPITSWGLEILLVKEFVSKRIKRSELIGTSFLLRIGMGALVGSLILLFESQNNDLLFWFTLCLMLPLGSGRTIEFFFQSEEKFKQISLVGLASIVLSAGVKIYAIFIDAGMLVIAMAFTLEWALNFMIYLVLYMKKNHISELFSWSNKVCSNFLKEGFFLLLSSLIVVIYMRIDLIMVEKILGGQFTGIYSASGRVLEATFMIPQVLLVIVFPNLVRYFEENKTFFRVELSKVFYVCLGVSFASFFLGWCFSGDFEEFVLGESYLGVGDLLKVHLGGLCFATLSMIWSRVLMVKEAHREQMVRNIIGLSVNVGLNYVLIPRYGIQGAAWASLVSYVYLGVIHPILSSNCRTHLIDLFSLKLLKDFIALKNGNE